MNHLNRMLPFVAHMLTYGFAIVRGVPRERGEVVRFARLIGPVRDTNWGAMFEVETATLSGEKDGVSTADVAYTTLKIPLHVDNPYRDPVPGFQLLHCLVQSEAGGDSLVGDGFNAAKLLRAENPTAFAVLCKTKVQHTYYDGKTELHTHVPHIALDPWTGEVARITFSGRLDYAPASAGPAGLDAYFAARRRFYQLLHDPANELRYKMSEGDLLMVDNTRVLHGRAEFSEPAGATGGEGKRHLQGCYIDRDGMTSTFHLGRRAAAAISAAGGRRSFSTSARSNRKVSFTALKTCTKEDIELSAEMYREECSPERMAARALAMLKQQDDVSTECGAHVNLYQHGLQTATRALRAGESEELVVCALLHDIGEMLSPANHGEIVAAMLRPYISADNYWVLANHEVFQGLYYFHHLGGDREKRQIYRDHPAFKACADFCERYDQPSFDPSYESLPLAHFEPMVRRVFERPAYALDPANPKRGAVTGEQIGRRREFVVPCSANN